MSALVPQRSEAAEAAISAELVACTLGLRSRPELRTEAPGFPDLAQGGVIPEPRGLVCI